jgi:hypothetical protein
VNIGLYNLLGAGPGLVVVAFVVNAIYFVPLIALYGQTLAQGCCASALSSMRAARFRGGSDLLCGSSCPSVSPTAWG